MNWYQALSKVSRRRVEPTEELKSTSLVDALPTFFDPLGDWIPADINEKACREVANSVFGQVVDMAQGAPYLSKVALAADHARRVHASPFGRNIGLLKALGKVVEEAR